MEGITRVPSLVSVVIPVYDRPEAFRACLVSVFAQTYKPIEVIVVNDGSAQTASIEKIAKDFPLTAYVYQTNKGAPAARNRGFRSSSGEFVLFCDADLCLKPTMVAHLVDALHEHTEASYSYCAFRFGLKKFPLIPFSPERLQSFNYINTNSLLRAVDFPGFDESLKRFQDWDLWLTLLDRGKTGVGIPDVLYSVQSAGTMSRWLPSFFYKLFPKSERVRNFKNAQDIVKRKHGLV